MIVSKRSQLDSKSCLNSSDAAISYPTCPCSFYMRSDYLLEAQLTQRESQLGMAPTRRASRSDVAVFAIALSLACFLFLLRLGSKSLGRDEGFSVWLARLDTAEFLHLLRTRELNASPYFILLRGWLHWGTGEATIRMLSVIPAVVAVATIYYLGKRLFSPWVGAVSALLLALNASLVTYAQQARGYSLAIFLVTLSSLLLVRQIQGGSWLNWCAYIAVSVLVAYTHFVVLLVLAAQWLSLAFLKQRPRRSQLITGFCMLFLLLAPLLVFCPFLSPVLSLTSGSG